METLIVTIKNKTKAIFLQQLLGKIKGVEKVRLPKQLNNDDAALINAINEGRTGVHINTDSFLRKLKNAGKTGRR